MTHDSLVARSFSRREQKKLGYVTFLACLFTIVLIMKNLDPVPALNLRLSTGAGQTQMLNVTTSSLQVAKEVILADDTFAGNETNISQKVVSDAEMQANKTKKTNTKTGSSQQIFEDPILKDELVINDTSKSEQRADQKTELICNTTGRSSFCEVKGDIRIDGNSASVFIVSSINELVSTKNTSWNIRPYARNGDETAMSYAREWSVKLVADDRQRDIPQCTQYHHVPAILFSLGGYSGNHFHAFSDVIVPLYATARPFNGEVQFLVTNKSPWWIAKYEKLLKELSRYEFFDIDKTDHIHCFTKVIVGLRGVSKRELSIDASQSAHSMKDFKQFLRSSYSLKKAVAIKIRDGDKKRPRLLIISRKRTRAFTNADEIARMARRLGYEVTVAEASEDIAGFAEIVNSCDVLIGVHGAGLTNSVFLPENAILIQVVPYGLLDWIPRLSFQDPTEDMNLRYLDYKIKLNESTLKQQYPENHVVLKDPSSLFKQGWWAFGSIYMDKQNVTLDVKRFRFTLLKALELLHYD